MGIESEKSYSGKIVIELIDTVEAEAEESIKNAFAEGYKAGVAEYKPDVVRLVAVNESLKKDLLKALEKKGVPLWVMPLTGVLCFFGGFAGGALIAR